MAQIFGYSILNGTSNNYPYNLKVETQEDIEKLRKDFHVFYNLDVANKKIEDNNKLCGVKDSYYEIVFYIKQLFKERLMA